MPSPTYTGMVTWKPNLPEIGLVALKLFPECRAECEPGFVQGQGMECVFHAVGYLGIAELPRRNFYVSRIQFQNGHSRERLIDLMFHEGQ